MRSLTPTLSSAWLGELVESLPPETPRPPEYNPRLRATMSPVPSVPLVAYARAVRTDDGLFCTELKVRWCTVGAESPVRFQLNSMTSALAAGAKAASAIAAPAVTLRSERRLLWLFIPISLEGWGRGARSMPGTRPATYQRVTRSPRRRWKVRRQQASHRPG